MIEATIVVISAPSKSADNEEYEKVEPGHLYPKELNVPTLPPNFAPRMKSVSEVRELVKDLEEHKRDIDSRLIELKESMDIVEMQGSMSVDVESKA